MLGMILTPARMLEHVLPLYGFQEIISSCNVVPAICISLLLDDHIIWYSEYMEAIQ